MPDTCIFCKIAKGEIPCAKVYEDKDVLAFLDLRPAAPGHTLLIPKAHAAHLLELDPALGRAIVSAMQKIGAALQKATGAEGFNCLQNNFPAAGQEIMHAHWHIIPRTANDKLAFTWISGNYATTDTMNSLADLLKKSI